MKNSAIGIRRTQVNTPAIAGHAMRHRSIFDVVERELSLVRDPLNGAAGTHAGQEAARGGTVCDVIVRARIQTSHGI
jgi:hypothetical protein